MSIQLEIYPDKTFVIAWHRGLKKGCAFEKVNPNDVGDDIRVYGIFHNYYAPSINSSSRWLYVCSRFHKERFSPLKWPDNFQWLVDAVTDFNKKYPDEVVPLGRSGIVVYTYPVDKQARQMQIVELEKLIPASRRRQRKQRVMAMRKRQKRK